MMDQLKETQINKNQMVPAPSDKVLKNQRRKDHQVLYNIKKEVADNIFVI